jgi:TetR/AcrR family transcriptional repressor of nem operon
MPRVSKAQAELHREAITEASAKLFKERGLKAVSVADLMGAAGLTHGGFYVHFKSKDALAGIASARAFEQASERWQQRIAGKTDAASQRAAIIEGYLQPSNVRRAAEGCPTAALVVDVAREPEGSPIRESYHDGLEAMLTVLASTEGTGDAATDRRRALVDYATLAGALLLARATSGHPLSDEIMAAAREHLLSSSQNTSDNNKDPE